MSTFVSFKDLSDSKNMEDQVIFDYLKRLLANLFGRHDDIIIDFHCETDVNHQLIRDQWKSISLYFKVPNRVKSTQKCVKQTLKHIVDYLNNHYQFTSPIKMSSEKKSYRAGDLQSSINYTILNLV